MNNKDIANLAKTKDKTAGKGSKPRRYNKAKFDEGYENINWRKAVKWQSFTDNIVKKG